jgi:hypothetical protein
MVDSVLPACRAKDVMEQAFSLISLSAKAGQSRVSKRLD